LNGRDEQGRDIVFRDPMGQNLKSIASVSRVDPTPLLAQRDIFSEELAGSPEFVRQVSRFLRRFYETGTRATLRMALEPLQDGG